MTDDAGTVGDDVYAVQLAVTVTGDLDPQRLRQAVSAVIARHPNLAARFHDEFGEPVQVLAADRATAWQYVELTGAADDIDARSEQLCAAERSAVCDLAGQPTFRAALIRTDDRHQKIGYLEQHGLLSSRTSISSAAPVDEPRRSAAVPVAGMARRGAGQRDGGRCPALTAGRCGSPVAVTAWPPRWAPLSHVRRAGTSAAGETIGDVERSLDRWSIWACRPADASVSRRRSSRLRNGARPAQLAHRGRPQLRAGQQNLKCRRWLRDNDAIRAVCHLGYRQVTLADHRDVELSRHRGRVGSAQSIWCARRAGRLFLHDPPSRAPSPSPCRDYLAGRSPLRGGE